MNDVSNYKTILRINKQHFKYKHCGKTFLAEDSVSDRRCSIARRVKQAILELLSEPLSMSLIARMKHIFPTTVIRILHSLRPKAVSLNQPLLEVVCFDEFKSVKNVSGAMSFVMMDGKTHQLIDIVENRQLDPLRDYFLRYPRKVREQVRLVVSDFYTPYRTLVKECFPNARIVADRFHISQHIGRAFTNHRIQVMKTFKKGDRRSKHLKKYWRLLQKNAWELKGQHRYWRPSFRDHLTEAEIVDRLLSYDDSLKRGYEGYKELPEHYQPVHDLQEN